MPRSSRHKSSKHSSREGREYSDSEKDSSVKERKSKEESVSHRSSKDSASGEKRKYDSKPVDGKDLAGAENADFVGEYGGSSSKRRKEKVDDDRWTGGDPDERESLKAEKDLKGLTDSKSRSRRGDESSGLAVDVDEGKRSGSKVDAKHHRSERKDRSEKDWSWERDRKGKEYSTSDRYLDGEAVIDITGGEGSKKQHGLSEDRAGKHLSGNSGVVSVDARRNPDHDKELERRFRKKDSSSDVDKNVDGREVDDRRQSSRDEIVKLGKYKDDGREDDRYKDKYGDDMEKDSQFQDDKQQHRDGRHLRDYVRNRSDEKHMRNEKKDLDVQEKKSKTQDNDRDHGRSRYPRHHDDYDRDDRNRDFDLDRDGDTDGRRDVVRDRGRDVDHDRGRDMDRDRGRDHDRDRGRDFDRDRERERYRRDRDRERERDRDRARDFSNDHGREWDYDHDRDYTSYLDDRSSRYKEDRSRRRSPDDYDDYYNDKARSAKADAHVDREKSVSRRTHSEAVPGSSRGRTSPGSRPLVNMDKYRDNRHDDFRYGDSREMPTMPDKISKYPTSDKYTKLDDNHLRDPSAERSPRMKTSPLGLLEKSPSSTSIDRKYVNRSGRKRSLDFDEAERRSSGSNDVRDGSVNDDRQSKDLSSKKEHSPAESSFHHKSSQANGPFLGHGPPSYKSGADSPLIGSMGEDSRGHSSRYRRSVDPNLGRSHGNMWKGVPNWPTPLQTGFMPFPPGPHGPPHGGFPSMLPQFPSPSMYGVRPPMEMNHSGIPYPIPDADRFNHIRPLGWQNLVDGTASSHFHGWDGNSGVFREEPPVYGPGSMSNGRARDANADVWKPNGDVKMENDAKKDGHPTKNFTDEACVTSAPGYNLDNSQHDDQGKSVSRKTLNGTPTKALLVTTKVTAEKTPESPAADDGVNSLRHYLSALDISVELTNPELYNEFVNLAVIEQNEKAQEKEDLNVEMAKAVDSKIANATMGFSLFPAAEDSIFKRAMDLYKTHGADGKHFHIYYEDESNNPTSSDMKVTEHEQGQEDKQIDQAMEMDEPVHYQEIQGRPMEEPSSATVQIEQVETSSLPTGGSDDGFNPSCEVAAKEAFGTENIESMSPKLTSDDALKSNTDAEMRITEDETGENEPAPCVVEQLGSEVGGSLNLPHGPVKVCEGLMPVSNESESGTLTPVHHAPESTH